MGECNCSNCTVCEPQDIVAEQPCDVCSGTMTAGLTDHALHRGDKVLLVRHIPAYVCRQCGNAYYELAQTRSLQRQFDLFLTRAVSCRVEEYQESDENE